MTRTNLFESKHLYKCNDLQEFLLGKDISINIVSVYRNTKDSIDLVEFLYIEYPIEIELLIEYWSDINNVKFYY